MPDPKTHPDTLSTLARETDFIRFINRYYPDRSDIRHFLSAGMNRKGFQVFCWKFHGDLTLQIGWSRDNLRIFQRLEVNGVEESSSFPVTWGNSANVIPFDGSGEAILTGEMAHLLWGHVRERLGTRAERS